MNKHTIYTETGDLEYTTQWIRLILILFQKLTQIQNDRVAITGTRCVTLNLYRDKINIEM